MIGCQSSTLSPSKAQASEGPDPSCNQANVNHTPKMPIATPPLPPTVAMSTASDASVSVASSSLSISRLVARASGLEGETVRLREGLRAAQARTYAGQQCFSWNLGQCTFPWMDTYSGTQRVWPLPVPHSE